MYPLTPIIIINDTLKTIKEAFAINGFMSLSFGYDVKIKQLYDTTKYLMKYFTENRDGTEMGDHSETLSAQPT